MYDRQRYDSLMGRPTRPVLHYEHWSCPDAESYITGIDYYEHPRLCRQKMAQLYPKLRLGIPDEDKPIPRPRLDGPGHPTAVEDAHGAHHVRWGTGETWQFDWGKQFTSIEQILAFSPLEQGDFTSIPVVESRDYRDEGRLFEEYRAQLARQRGIAPDQLSDAAPDGDTISLGFYNTLFMWPLLTFGYERFMEVCLEPEFERIMNEFAELSRRVFRVLARLPVNFVVCHDDIVNTRGPVCSPQWMHKHIFPWYEEYWSMLREAGKTVIFMVDGRVNAYADDVYACGARGFITEPYTVLREIRRKHPDIVLMGEGDNRILSRNDPQEIEGMVRRMVETARMGGGYRMCIGNHIPWDIPPTAVKLYLDLSERLTD